MNMEDGESAHEARKRHAALLRDLLVAINNEYRARFGGQTSSDVRVKEEPRGLEREVRDVEMIAV